MSPAWPPSCGHLAVPRGCATSPGSSLCLPTPGRGTLDQKVHAGCLVPPPQEQRVGGPDALPLKNPRPWRLRLWFSHAPGVGRWRRRGGATGALGQALQGASPGSGLQTVVPLGLFLVPAQGVASPGGGLSPSRGSARLQGLHGLRGAGPTVVQSAPGFLICKLFQQHSLLRVVTRLKGDDAHAAQLGAQCEQRQRDAFMIISSSCLVVMGCQGAWSSWGVVSVLYCLWGPGPHTSTLRSGLVTSSQVRRPPWHPHTCIPLVTRGSLLLQFHVQTCSLSPVSPL